MQLRRLYEGSRLPEFVTELTELSQDLGVRRVLEV
jgi:hypothetical protein